MIAILCAMDKELIHFMNSLDNPVKKVIMGYDFVSGKINNQEVVLVKSGIGKVQAGIVTALLIEHFKPTIVINSGVAGGFDLALKTKDIVFATKVGAYDVDFTADGAPYGSLNGLPRFVERPKLELRLPNQDINLYYGLILSGDTFATNRDYYNQLFNTYYEGEKVLALDMESASVAYVCTQYQIPWVIIRSISDVIGTSISEYYEWADQAAFNAYQLILNNYLK